MFFNGRYSKTRIQTWGVPQGRCLGPLLFNILTKDLLHVLNKTNIVIYADDSIIYTSTLTTKEIQTIINNEFKVVAEWIKENKIVLNIFVLL